jgi:predicted benzoate:H+ symporter BenE
MEERVIAFLVAHQTIILMGLGWLFSAAMSTMPALSVNAGFWSTWFYKFAQAVAANFNKHDAPLPK